MPSRPEIDQKKLMSSEGIFSSSIDFQALSVFALASLRMSGKAKANCRCGPCGVSPAANSEKLVAVWLSDFSSDPLNAI
jgi:hypothetical protein